jgi:hypothetical protein
MTTPAPSISKRVSRKATQFTESVIREMTREAMKYGAVNLSQGFPDFAAPEDIKRRHKSVRDHLGCKGFPRCHRPQNQMVSRAGDRSGD